MSTMLVGLLLLSIAKPAPLPPDPAGPALGVVDAWEAIATGSAILIDVREESEIKQGMANPALWMPISTLDSDPDRWRALLASLPKGRTLIFYCAHGGRAYRAAASAAGLGYPTARMAPFSEWVRAGLPVKIPAPRS
jgi:rhodanese-related sulfurtransferase